MSQRVRGIEKSIIPVLQCQTAEQVEVRHKAEDFIRGMRREMAKHTHFRILWDSMKHLPAVSRFCTAGGM